MGKLAVAVIVGLWVVPVSLLFDLLVPHPYMDEIFHIPQAQQYCRGNFWSWDPMITTPPGLWLLDSSWVVKFATFAVFLLGILSPYIVSLPYVACLAPRVYLERGLLSFVEACSTPILRSVNCLLAVICSVLMYEIICHLRPGSDKRNVAFAVVVLSLYPLHWFFTFLYYTDVASLTAVLAMYLSCLKKRYHISALIGVAAVLFRQTNIIWMLFVACIGFLDKTLGQQRERVKEDDFKKPLEMATRPAKDNAKGGSNLKRRKLNNVTTTTEASPITVGAPAAVNSSGLFGEIQAVCLRSWKMKLEILFFFIPFLTVLVAFVAFVLWNGSIVLGAKEAHTVSPHFAQLMYFSLVSTLMMAPFHFSPSHLANTLQSLWKNRPVSFCYLLLALTAGFVSVHFFSIAHPYLLADNRHYTFYLWRKVVMAHWSTKYLLVPAYVYSWFSTFSILRKVNHRIWVLAYFLSTAAILVPAPLVEFRYYTIPFFFLALHTPVDDMKRWGLVGVSFIAINIFTTVMFLFRPFHWSHEPGVQRFIW